MSKNSIVLQTANQITVNTDLSKIFVWDNRYQKGTVNNATYDDIVLLQGQLMGRVSATQKLKKLASGSNDGSQFPVGILAEDYTVQDMSDQDVYICVSGDVDETLLVFDGSDNLNTVVSGRSLRDRIGADTVGIKLVTADRMTDYDNN